MMRRFIATFSEPTRHSRRLLYRPYTEEAYLLCKRNSAEFDSRWQAYAARPEICQKSPKTFLLSTTLRWRKPAFDNNAGVTDLRSISKSCEEILSGVMTTFLLFTGATVCWWCQICGTRVTNGFAIHGRNERISKILKEEISANILQPE